MVELTLQKLTDRMARFVNWDATDWPTEISPAMVANEVGDWLFGAVEWNFLNAATVDLDLVNGQSYIALPADFGTTTERSVRGKTFSYFALALRTMEEVALARQIAASPGAGYYVGALIFEDPVGTVVTPTPRIEIGPVPTSDFDAAFTLTYSRRFVPVDSPDDVCRVPDFMQPLYIRACCLWLAGYEKDAGGSLEDRMDRLQASSLWMNAISRDANTQQGFGPSSGSAASQVDDAEWPAGMPVGRVPTIV
jgi:hypothetical protein